MAHVKALVLHILFDAGLGDEYFRLKYGHRYLREPLHLQDYNIGNMSVLEMVPLSLGDATDNKPLSSAPRMSASLLPKHVPQTCVSDETLKALQREMSIFKRREEMLRVFHVCFVLF